MCKKQGCSSSWISQVRDCCCVLSYEHTNYTRQEPGQRDFSRTYCCTRMTPPFTYDVRVRSHNQNSEAVLCTHVRGAAIPVGSGPQAELKAHTCTHHPSCMRNPTNGGGTLLAIAALCPTARPLARKFNEIPSGVLLECCV